MMRNQTGSPLVCCWIDAGAIFSCLLFASVAVGQAAVADRAAADTKPALLAIVDEDGREHAVSGVEFAELPRQKARVRLHDQDAEFEGPLLSDVLKLGGVKLGDDLKGRRAATIALLEAMDDYRVVMTLVDLDAATVDDVAILADRRDGKPLAADEAPYRLIVPGDKRPIRWIRMVRSIRILNLKDAAAEQTEVDRAATPGK